MKKITSRGHWHTASSSTIDAGADTGFTLIELLIVIVVLGILAAVVVFSLGNVTASAAVASCQSDVKTVQTAVQAYEVQNSGALPDAAALTSGSHSYLQSFPSSPYYTITLVNGAVMVAAPSTVTAVSGLIATSCSGAGAGSATTSSTSSTTSTTTTVPPSNGVLISAVGNASGNVYFGQDNLYFSNASSTTAITITVSVDASSGINYNGAYYTFGSFTLAPVSTSGGKITYTYTGDVSPYNSSGQVSFQYNIPSGDGHDTSLDTWSVTSTHGGITATQSGHF